MVEPALFGPIDAVLGDVARFLVLGLVILNLVTRYVAHRSYVAQAETGAESIDRHLGHDASNVLLLLGSFYYLTIHHHSGVVLATLVIGAVVADVFEFEARNVEARQGWELEKPKGALLASALVALYAAFLSLFFVIRPLWNAIV